MIESLIIALVLCVVVCIIVGIIVQFVPLQAPFSKLIWAIAALICCLILLAAVTGHRFHL
jgi:hypothetical protein